MNDGDHAHHKCIPDSVVSHREYKDMTENDEEDGKASQGINICDSI